jgi:excisionase family DNA binding protein
MDPTATVVLTTPAALDGLIERAVERAVLRLAPRFRTDERDRPSKEWLTSREVRAYTGWSKATCARRRADGTLPYSRVGQSVFVKRADVEALLESSRTSRTSGAAR